MLAEATALRDRARREAGDPGAWREALAALERAEGQGPEVEVPARRDPGRSEARPSATSGCGRSWSRSGPIRQDVGPDGTDAAYATAFRDAGLDLDALEPDRVRPAAEAAARGGR